jgi:hypothetical protein
MPAGAVGKLGAKLVDDFGASADEAARIINDLDADTVRTLDENPQVLDEIGDLRVQADETGGIGSRIRDLRSSGDETGGSVLRGSGDDAGLVPQSTLGRVGAGAVGAGLGFQGLRTLSDREQRIASQAESDLVEEQATTLREVVRNEQFSSEEKARVLSELSGSGFVRSSVSGGQRQKSAGNANGGGDDGGVIPDDPVTVVIAVIVLVIVLRSVLDNPEGDTRGG